MGSTAENTLTVTKFFLSESQAFRSMVELISYYTAHSLKHSFSGLDMTLKFPFRDLSLVRAEYDFTPEKNDSNMLMFKSHDVLAVIDSGGESGWWKAIKDNRIGYIPKDFVSSF